MRPLSTASQLIWSEAQLQRVEELLSELDGPARFWHLRVWLQVFAGPLQVFGLRG